jgi:hypothetical protein
VTALKAQYIQNAENRDLCTIQPKEIFMTQTLNQTSATTTVTQGWVPTNATFTTVFNVLSSVVPVAAALYAPKTAAVFVLDTYTNGTYSQAGETPLTTAAVSAEYMVKDYAATAFTFTAGLLDMGLTATIGTDGTTLTAASQTAITVLSTANNTVVQTISAFLPNDAALSASAADTSLIGALFKNDIVRAVTIYSLGQHIELGTNALNQPGIIMSTTNLLVDIGISTVVALTARAINYGTGVQAIPETTSEFAAVYAGEYEYLTTTVAPVVVSTLTACGDTMSEWYTDAHAYFYPETVSTTEHTA